MPIRLLSDKVSSMIAAGEVVERPASVVKELIENALDAGATEISVEIRDGGVEQIRVSDNGCGIPHDEVEIAFQRFATSKLSDASDLDAIPTLGFRGEALPSIASVARMSVVTRHMDEDSGTRLDLEEGVVSDKKRQGASPGTVMTVRQLFRNVPARRKFLRTAPTETSHIQNMVTRYALAYPEVRFALNTGRSSLRTPGSGRLRETIAAIYSLDVAENMLDIAEYDERVEQQIVTGGMICQPAFSRANRSYMNFFVNRRWVQSRMLGYALEQAYHGFMKERRYPMAVVNIAIDYDLVDVNVHPSKTEVRFRNGDRVFSAVQQAVRHTLTAYSPVPELRRAGINRPAYPYAPTRDAGRNFWPIEPFNLSPSFTSDRNGERTTELQDVAPLPGTDDAAGFTHKQALPALRVLGQVQSTYIAAEGPDGMYLIDQHAAHERIMFERIKAEAAASAPQSQSLMEPLTIELNPVQQELAQAHMQIFASLGLLIEPFGGNVYIIRAVPSILTDVDPAKAFVDVLDEMAQGGDVESWSERAAYSLACHAAIRAGKALTREEMTALTRDLERCQQPHTCPHGRPTIIHLSGSRLEREFGRR
jgi:DNA mismatch repair protein MutL